MSARRTLTSGAARVRAAPRSAWRGLERRAHSLSLRARLVTVVTSLVLLALALVSVVTLAILQHVLIRQLDDNLRAATSSTRSLDTIYSSSFSHLQDGDLPSDYVVQIFNSSGNALGDLPTQAANSRHGSLDLDDVTPAWVARHPDPMTLTSATGDRWRVQAVAGQLGVGGPPISIVVALPLDDVDTSVTAVAAWLLVVGLSVVLAGGLLGVAAINRAFRPLREVEQVAGAFGAGDLSRRVTSLPPGTEVGRLGGAINEMLDRIGSLLAAREASEARMRRFVGDASHELRTPLAAVRGFAELYRMGAVRAEGDVAQAFSRIEQEATRLGGLVDDLLLLARLDEQRPLRAEGVDLLMLAADAAADARALDRDRTVSVTGIAGAPPSPALVIGDEGKLRQVITNLVANALRHTPAGTPVEIGVGVRDGRALWQVIDHGHGIDPADADKVFERFWRADSSRQRATGGGAGLGMAIVAAIVAAHHGGVRVLMTPGGGATFQVDLPAQPHAAEAEGDSDDEPGLWTDSDDSESAALTSSPTSR